MDKLISDRIRIMGLLCTLMVVYRHSLNYLAFFNSWNWKGTSGFVELGCSKLTQVAVPSFFIISGFFFLRKSYYENGTYWNMIKKKVTSLLFPFLFWNIIGGIVLFVVDSEKIGNNVLDCLLQLINSNWYAPLWYVRDLMTIMVLVPLYGWIFVGFPFKSEFCRIIIHISLLIGLFIYWNPEDCGWVSTEGLFFFYLGGLISRNEHLLKCKIPLYLLIPLTCLWLYNCFFVNLYNYHYLNKFNTILAAFICWNIIAYLYKNKNSMVLKLSLYSFFIYVTHFYLIKTLKTLFGKFFFGSDIAATITYLLLPLLTVCIVVIVGRILNRHYPKFYSFITGGR